MGDFNLTPDSGFYTQICEFLSDTAVMMNNEEDTFPGEAPIKRIDYIFVDKEMKILHAFGSARCRFGSQTLRDNRGSVRCADDTTDDHNVDGKEDVRSSKYYKRD